MSKSSDYSRRVFLQALGMSAAGVVLGGGAAWAYGQTAEKDATQAIIQDLEARLTAAQQNSTSLDGSVVGLQQQITGLNSQLGQATSQNAQLAQALAEAQKEAQDLKTGLAEAQSQTMTAQDQLNAANSQLDQFRQLIALYEQLENIGLDGLTRDGLATMSTGIAAATGLMPMVSGGLQTAGDLLSGFEKLIPDFNDGLTWLNDQIIKLKLGLMLVENSAQKVASSAAVGVVGAFGGFMKFVLDYLPFNIGQKSRAALESTQAYITQSTVLTEGANERVFGKMSRYVAKGPENWQKKLVAPIREQTLAPVGQLLAALTDSQTQFTEKVDRPVQAALTQRAAVRDQIAAFRRDHQL
jgi:uncharacterized phage infection (PIP) family protein YhgE